MLNILFLGIVSMLIDFSTEMVYPLIPIYLTSVLGATPAIVGVIEGIAESIASLLKVFAGYVSDKYRNKKLLTVIGYSGSFIYKFFLLIAASWPGVLLARIVDRFGKGIRTAPRDALIAESAEKGRLGGSFGFHKMFDMLGSSLGIITSYFLISGNSVNFKQIFVISMIPAVFGVLAIFPVKEKKIEVKSEKKLDFRFKELDGRLKAFLIIIFIFSLGNSSNTFLLLRAQNIGYSVKSVILLYFLFNFATSVLAYPLGKLSDKIGRKTVLVTGYLFYGAVYLGFAQITSRAGMIVLFALYGVYTALTSGAERALISEISPADKKGTMLGMYATLVGVGLLPASVIAGFLWDIYGASAPFIFGGGLGITAAISILFTLKKPINTTETI